MSRAYRIRVSESVEQIIHVDDGISSPLDLLPVLPKEGMKRVLKKVLEDQGFTIEGDMAKREDDDGITIVIDLEKSEIQLKIQEEEEVRATATVDVTADYQQEDLGRSKAKSQLEEKLDKKIERTEEHLQRKITEKLEGKLRDIRVEIDRIINKATAEALKERARQMGEIEELHEDPESGSMTIKVRL